MTHFQSLSAAGFAATAISYGPGRVGFGLFVPAFSGAFSLDGTTIGLISSLGFGGFFLALLTAQYLLNRQGPEVPVLAGLASATVGMALVAAAPSLPVLAAGVFLASASAGFAWTPFNDAVHRKIRDIDRATALSEISTGTGIGIALAGAAALAMVFTGVSWRLCWALFAGASALALVANWASLRHVEKDPETVARRSWRALMEPSIVPMLTVGFAFGFTSSIYISFAARHIADAGGVPGVPGAATPAVVFLCFGLAGLAGLMASRFRSALGLTPLLRLTMAAGAGSLALAALLPGNWLGLAGSAALQGVHVMVISAVLAFWSERLFPAMPTLSFTAALLATAAGNILGPAVAGTVSDTLGMTAMFMAAAVVPASVALSLRGRYVREYPAALGAAA